MSRLLPLLFLLFFLGSAEFISRLWTNHSGGPVDKTLGLLHSDATLGWKTRPHLQEVFFHAPLKTDQNGFRIRDTLETENNEWSIWTYGPSSAFGWGVAAHASYPFLTAKILGTRAKNLGQIGYSSTQGLSLLQLNPPPSHTIVVFSYGINDLDRFRFFFPSPVSDADFFLPPLPAPLLLLADLVSRSHLFRYSLRSVAYAKKQFFCRLPREIPRRVSDAAYLKNLQLFQEKTKAAGAQLILLDTPYWPVKEPPPIDSSEVIYDQAYNAASAGDCSKSDALFNDFLQQEQSRILRDLHELNKKMGAFAIKNKIPLVKASELLTHRDDFVDPIHPSAIGHGKIAQKIARLVESFHLFTSVP